MRVLTAPIINANKSSKMNNHALTHSIKQNSASFTEFNEISREMEGKICVHILWSSLYSLKCLRIDSITWKNEFN